MDKSPHRKPAKYAARDYRTLYRDNAKAIAAFAAGEDVQFRTAGSNGPWKPFDDTDDIPPAFADRTYEWRPAPSVVFPSLRMFS
jgi:hypothetical protein